MSQILLWILHVSSWHFCLNNRLVSSAASDDYDDEIDLSKYVSAFLDKPSAKTGEIVSKLSPDSQVNPEELGEYLEGDILFESTEEWKNGIIASSKRWENGVVPYVINGEFKDEEKAVIRDAMKEFEKHSCLRFRKKKSKDKDYINIQNKKKGCYSGIGRTGGGQIVNLQRPECVRCKGTPMHELMHAVGFFHEHVRYDRDDFVRIIWKNIQSGHAEEFIKLCKEDANSFGVKYDYGSIMHFSRNAFSINNTDTIAPKNCADIGQRTGFSKGDIKKLNAMYNCHSVDRPFNDGDAYIYNACNDNN